jgi:predicted phage-related endonuclease
MHNVTDTRVIAERHTPATREEWLGLRQRDVTASQIAALLGLHPYVSPYQLWAEKTGKLIPVQDDNAVLRRGRLLESVAVSLAAEEMPDAKVIHNSNNTYWRARALRIGATPDLTVECPERGLGVVQLKSIEPGLFKKQYADGVPPLWIACQALTEAKLVGAEWAAVGALRVGFSCEFDLYPVPLHEPIWQRLVEAVEAFWLSVERDTPPLPDYSRDGKLLQNLAGASDGSTIELSGDNELMHALHERERTRQLLGVIEADAERIDTLIRHKMGAAESALAGDFRITLKTQNRVGYTVKPSTSRPLKVKRIRETQN